MAEMREARHPIKATLCGCEHVRVASQGTPHARFRRAIASGDLDLVRAAVLELPEPVGLDDAVDVCFLIAEHEPHRYPEAAKRWLMRLVAERAVNLEQLQRVTAAMHAVEKGETQEARALMARLARYGGSGRCDGTPPR